jgi:hypothetical protein
MEKEDVTSLATAGRGQGYDIESQDEAQTQYQELYNRAPVNGLNVSPCVCLPCARLSDRLRPHSNPELLNHDTLCPFNNHPRSLVFPLPVDRFLQPFLLNRHTARNDRSHHHTPPTCHRADHFPPSCLRPLQDNQPHLSPLRHSSKQRREE